MRAARTLSLMSCLFWAGAALAQPAPDQPQGKIDGADQVVGLFGATCLHYAGDVAALRGFLTEQHAPAMPPQARDAFLSGRAGQAFDVSYQTVRLALVSFDDGGCEAVADQANPDTVLAVLQQAASENQVALTPLGAQPDKQRAGVRHEAYMATLAGRQMHILVSTATSAPQAVLTLAPR